MRPGVPPHVEAKVNVPWSRVVDFCAPSTAVAAAAVKPVNEPKYAAKSATVLKSFSEMGSGDVPEPPVTVIVSVSPSFTIEAVVPW